MSLKVGFFLTQQNSKIHSSSKNMKHVHQSLPLRTHCTHSQRESYRFPHILWLITILYGSGMSPKAHVSRAWYSAWCYWNVVETLKRWGMRGDFRYCRCALKGDYGMLVSSFHILVMKWMLCSATCSCCHGLFYLFVCRTGTEPKALCALGRHSAPEIQPQDLYIILR
jgi:hypothetical protein